MANIRNAESAYLMASARYKDWLAQFLEEWNRPIADAAMIAAWEMMPDEIKDQMREANPEAYDQVAERMKALKGG